jgi:hypothetical protein
MYTSNANANLQKLIDAHMAIGMLRPSSLMTSTGHYAYPHVPRMQFN